MWHNAINSVYPYALFYPENQPNIIPAQPQLREYLWSDESNRDLKLMKRCEHYSLAGYTSQVAFKDLRTHGGGGAYYWTWTNECPGRWFWDVVGSFLGGPTVATLGTFDLPMGVQPVLYRGDLEVDRVVDPKGLGGLLSTAYARIRPGIKPTMSLVNSLIELKDFKRLPAYVSSLKREFSKLQAWAARVGTYNLSRKASAVFANLSRPHPGAKLPSARVISKLAAESHLQVQFNLKPLVSDILGLTEALSSAAQQLKKLQDGAGRRRVVHTRIALRDSYRNSSDNELVKYETGSLVDWFGLERTTSYSPVVFTLSLDVSYQIRNLENQRLGLLALLDVLGVNRDPSIVWNAIPWSFVVDWVLNVSSWLGQFRSTNVNVDTVIHQACWSWHCTRIHKVWGSFNTQRGLLRQVVEEAYKRVPIRPQDVGMGIRSSDLTLREASLAAALGIARTA